MKNWLRDFFVFSNREHKGSICLLMLIALFILLPQLLLLLSSPNTVTDQELLEAAFQRYDEHPAGEQTRQLFPFNPNTVSKEELLQLGLSEKTTNLLINYRNKRGVFRSPADFKKIYTLPIATYNRLAPYLTFDTKQAPRTNWQLADQYDTLNYQTFAFDPNTISVDSLKMLGLAKNEISHLDNLRKKGIKFFKKEQFKVSSWRPHKMTELQGLAFFSTTSPPQPETTRIVADTSKLPKNNLPKELCDVNSATIDQFLRVSGIGPYYARTILEKRALLGSFIKIEQLSDFMPDSLYQKVVPQLKLSPRPVKKLKINSVDVQTLQQYPTLKYKAAIIINYRNNHGNFRSMLDLWKVEGIRKDILDKLGPYLDFES